MSWPKADRWKRSCGRPEEVWLHPPIGWTAAGSYLGGSSSPLPRSPDRRKLLVPASTGIRRATRRVLGSVRWRSDDGHRQRRRPAGARPRGRGHRPLLQRPRHDCGRRTAADARRRPAGCVACGPDGAWAAAHFNNHKSNASPICRPGVDWVQMSARVPLQQHAIPVRGILPLCGAFKRVHIRWDLSFSNEQENPADDVDAARVGALVPAIMSSAETRSYCGAQPATSVVDAEKHDHVCHARLGEHVAIESAQATVAVHVVGTRPPPVPWFMTSIRMQAACSLVASASVTGC